MRPIALRRARLLPLQAAAALGDLAASSLRRICRPRVLRPPAARPGISIVIPERGTPELLSACLAALQHARARVSEPTEVVVVSSGPPAERPRPEGVRLLASDEPLSFSRAVRRGLAAARHDWVYLLNSDMLLEPDALAELLPWRDPGVFAIASQIFLTGGGERRVETGWTDFRVEDGCAGVADVEPEDDRAVRGTLYAGGGSSLFQRRILLRLLGRRSPYEPFYWEDVEWGARAWMLGLEVLFCPASKARHRRRATVRRLYPEAEVERIFRRNGWLFQLRNLSGIGSLERLAAHILEADAGTFRELVSWRTALRVFAARVRLGASPFSDLSLCDARSRYYRKPRSAGRAAPALLVVSPYALYPPAHGGAIRIHRLVEQLAGEYEVTLVSDEASAYGPRSEPYFGRVAALHLVDGRIDPGPGAGRSARRDRHCHARLRAEVARRLACDRPDLVAIEFAELAGLVEQRNGVPWVLTLHEASFDSSTARTDEELQELELARRFDAVVACTEEDARLLGDVRADVVPNGVAFDALEYTSSEASRAILFLGPFRYRPNLDGIVRFLEEVYPRLREDVAGAELWILGGRDARQIAGDRDCFRQPGVTVYDYVADPRPFLRRAAATINPLAGSRGSSLKLIESIAAGRVCVSTPDGALGFAAAGFPALVVADSIGGFRKPLARLLLDPGYRLSIERPRPELLAAYTWDAAARTLAGVYGRCLRKSAR